MQGVVNSRPSQNGATRIGYSARVVRAAVAPEDPDGQMETSPQAISVDPREIEADARLEEAKNQANALVETARAQAKSIMDNANNEAKRACDIRMGQELLTFSRKLRTELDTVRPMLARMVIEAVEAIVGMLPDDEIAERMVRRALRDLDASTKAVLYASRADYVFLGQIVGKMQVSGDHSIHSVQVDSDLETGTCRVDAAGISLEIGLNAQLELLETLLLHEEPPKPPDDTSSEDDSNAEPDRSVQKNYTSHSSASKHTSPQEDLPKPAVRGVSSGGVSAMRRFAAEQKPTQQIPAALSVAGDNKNSSISHVMQEKSE